MEKIDTLMLISTFLCGFLMAAVIGGIMVVDTNRSWKLEVFNRGYMEKKIDQNDNVIYVWIEPKDK